MPDSAWGTSARDRCGCHLAWEITIMSAPVSMRPTSVISCPVNVRVHWHVGSCSYRGYTQHTQGVPVDSNSPCCVTSVKVILMVWRSKINWAIHFPWGTVQGGQTVQAIIIISLSESESITPGRTNNPSRRSMTNLKAMYAYAALVVWKLPWEANEQMNQVTLLWQSHLCQVQSCTPWCDRL